METVDLSRLFGDSPEREFIKEFKLGKEKGRILVQLWPPANEWYIYVDYFGPVKGLEDFGPEMTPRNFDRTYGLNEVPASLTRDLVRLGASDAYMRELTAAYDKILVEVTEVRHDQLHTDTSESGYDE